MPNWCNNYAVIDHTDPAKIRRLAEAFNESKFCDAVIPVPEDLKITAGFLGDEEAQKELERRPVRIKRSMVLATGMTSAHRVGEPNGM